MAEITAKTVNELRARTGLPMMKCKQLLTAAGGNLEKAFDAARKEGLKESIRERAATEGRVAVGTSPDRKVAAARPVALSRDQVPPELVAKEREIAIDQARATGKPQQIAEKIAEGKMNAFYAERVLLDQEFINADAYKGKVGDMIKARGAKLEKYVRLEVGQ